MNRPAMLKMRAVLADAAEGRFPPRVAPRFSMYRTLNASCPARLYIAAYPDSAGDLEMVEDLGRVLPVLGSLLGSEALAAHFDIPLEEATRIFDGESYDVFDVRDIYIEHVLQRLDELLAKADV